MPESTPPPDSTASRTTAAAPGSERRVSILERGFDDGERTYGCLAVPFASFAEHAEAQASARLRREGRAADEAGLTEVLALMPLSDLYVAIAGELGLAGAFEALARTHAPRLLAFAAKCGAGTREAEELVRELPGELFLAPGSGKARTLLGTYAGAGSLFSWLAAILLRRRCAAKKAKTAMTLELRENDATPAVGQADPAELLANEELASDLRDGLTRAFSKMTPKEKLALHGKYRHDLPQTGIARLLGVGEPRVSRLLESAIGKLKESFRGSAAVSANPREPGLWEKLSETLQKELATRQEIAPPPAGTSKAGQRSAHE